MADQNDQPSSRRGVFGDDSGNTWEMILLQMPGRSGPVDLDEIHDRLIEREIVGQSRRDVGAVLHAKRLPTPAGQWALLVSMPGQSWAYLLVSSLDDYDLPSTLARTTGLRVIWAGYQDTAGATGFNCFDGDEILVQFESCGMGGDLDEEEYADELEEAWNQTRFESTRLPKDWIERFESESEVQDALAREFDAYVPYIHASDEDDAISIYGYDDEEFEPGEYLRIDLLGFGGTRLEPSTADRRLRDAITASDIAAIRAAVAAGASLKTLPSTKHSPLHLALGRFIQGEASRYDRVAALLKLGADPNDPGAEPPAHVVLGGFNEDQAELIDLLDLLKSHGGDLHATGRELLTQGSTPLHQVAIRDWLAVAKYLVANGADLHATDPRGRTPRQVAEDAARSTAERHGGKAPHGEYVAMVDFLADAEAGRADLDWHADAEEASRRELRRKREMKLSFGKLGAAFQALGGVMKENPTREDLTEALNVSHPDAIHLEPDDSDWETEAKRAETAAALASEGFEPVGRFAIPEMPRIRLEAFHQPSEHLYGVIYDAEGQSILDLVRLGLNGTMLTVTTRATQPDEIPFDMPNRQTIHLAGSSVPRLLAALRDVPAPPAGITPVTAEEFTTVFEKSYRQEIKARKRLDRHKSRPEMKNDTLETENPDA